MHATMAILQRLGGPRAVIVVGGNDLDAARRAPGVPTYHSGQDINAMVRDITKWTTIRFRCTLRAIFCARLQDVDDAAL